MGTPLTHERFLRRHRGTYGERRPDDLLCLLAASAVLMHALEVRAAEEPCVLTPFPRAHPAVCRPRHPRRRRPVPLARHPRQPAVQLRRLQLPRWVGLLGSPCTLLVWQARRPAGVPAQLPSPPAAASTPAWLRPSPACTGIGLPAVAASGAVTANSLVSVGQHTALLKELGL